MLSPAKAMNGLMAYEFSMDIDRVFPAGFPRNDVFSLPSVDLRAKLGVDAKKIIIWYPTFRQNKRGSIVLPGSSLPLIHDKENAIQLNETAKREDVLILLKPHFAQDSSYIQDQSLSNIWFIGDEFFAAYGFSSYEMLAASDALITDYSSVYFDYTLADKPIAVVWEDIEEYRKNPGFALDLSYFLKGAEKIYTIDELCSFIIDVAHGKDLLQKERREIRDVVNFAVDGKSTERVVDFIVEKAKL